jgi:DnaJ-class molecular chaperone
LQHSTAPPADTFLLIFFLFSTCRNGEPGDLYVFISAKAHPELRREGVTIHSGECASRSTAAAVAAATKGL